MNSFGLVNILGFKIWFRKYTSVNQGTHSEFRLVHFIAQLKTPISVITLSSSMTVLKIIVYIRAIVYVEFFYLRFILFSCLHGREDIIYL